MINKEDSRIKMYDKGLPINKQNLSILTDS